MRRLSALCTAALFSSLLAAPVHAVEVLTSIKPLQLIAAAVQAGTGTPDVLLPPGASPHQYSLRPSDLRKLQQADLLYWIGPDMETFLEHTLDGRQKPSIAVQSLPGLSLRHFGTPPAGGHTEASARDEHDGHDDHDSHAEAAHDHAHRPGSLDAHLWLLPANARLIATRMAADLAQADPASAARYQANLQAFIQRLDTLDRYLQDRLKPLANKPFFVFHEAFDYFEQAYGLRHRGVFAVSSEAQPGARHVAAMRAQLEASGASCVFSEPPIAPRLAQTLSAGLPVRLAELDALGFNLPVSERGYEALLSQLGNALAGCLEGR